MEAAGNVHNGSVKANTKLEIHELLDFSISKAIKLSKSRFRRAGEEDLGKAGCTNLWRERGREEEETWWFKRISK